VIRAWFGNVTTDVALDSTISTTAKAVYLVLAVHADMETGECWVRNARIAEHLSVTRRTVITALNELVEAGAVSRVHRFEGGHQRSNLYTLLDVRRARRAGVS
jgi:DNA-binding MarR family transcriptional regulator